MTEIVDKNLQVYYLDLDSILRNIVQEMNEGFDLESIIPVTIQLMEACATFVTLTGENKKRIIVQLLKTFVVQNESLSKVLQKELFDFCEYTLPVFIDYIILTAKGKFKFKESCKKCKKFCLPSCISKKYHKTSSK